MTQQQHQSSTTGQTRRTYKTSNTSRQNASPANGGIVSRVHTLAVFTSTDFFVVVGGLFDVVKKSVRDVKTDDVEVVADVVVSIDGLFDVVKKSVRDVITDVAGGDVTGVEEVTIIVVVVG